MVCGKYVLILIVFVLLSSAVGAIDVSQPVQVTSNDHYERGESILYDGSNYWLFYGRSASVTGSYGNTNPDISDYQVYYKKAASIPALASAPPSPVDDADNIYQGQTSAVYYNGKVWVFAADETSADHSIKAWQTTDGLSWTELDTDLKGCGAPHLWAEVYDNKIFLAFNAQGNKIQVATYDGNSWSTPVDVTTHEGMPRFYVDSSDKLQLIWVSWGAPAYYIHTYNNGWSTTPDYSIPGTANDDCDPALFEIGGDYALVFAPLDGTKQYLAEWKAPTLAGLETAPSHIITNGGYGSNVWVDMWPVWINDGSDDYLFYTSERNPDDPNNEITGNIWYLKLDWDLGSDHYTYIQTAIDAANNGDTISVQGGTYSEQLTINKPLSLNAASTALIDVSGFGNTDGTGFGIDVSAPDVTIQGFEIIGIPDDPAALWSVRKSSATWPTIRASTGADGLIVSNCIFNVNTGDKGQEALFVNGGVSDVTFIGNTINNYIQGVGARGPVDNLVVGNNEFNIGYIRNDDVDHHTEIVGRGIQLWYGDGLTIANNIFNGPGIFDEPWTDNDLVNVYAEADFIGYFHSYAGYTDTATVTVTGNEITNFYIGMATFADGGMMSNNNVHNNLIGFQLGQVSGTWASAPAAGVEIINNDIKNNKRGIWVQSFVVDGIAAHNNNIVGNTEYGILNEDPENEVFKAPNNWWGHYTGPYKPSTNPNGQGDTVSNNVDYDPWLCDPLPSTWSTYNGQCDADKDSHAAEGYGGDDCNDNDAVVYPGNAEVCDAKDNNCNGRTDEGLGADYCQGTCEIDRGFVWTGNGGQLNCCGDDAGEGGPYENPETSCDGRDNNCNGVVDEGFEDTDSDGTADCVDDDDDNDGIPDISDPRPLIQNVAPVSEILSPDADKWFNDDFEVAVQDSDGDGDSFTCEYSVWARRAAAPSGSQWENTKQWTPRPCNDKFTVTVGRNKDCPYDGYDYCEVNVRATDEWGLPSSQGQSNNHKYSIDTTPPNIRTKTPMAGTYTGDTSPKIEAAVNDRGIGIDTLKMFVDSVDITGDTTLSPRGISYTPSLQDGVHTVRVTAADKLGNSNGLDWSFTVDSTMPDAEILQPEHRAYGSRRLLVQVGTNDEKVKRVMVRINYGRWQTFCRGCTGGLKRYYFREGENTLEAEAVDYAGNTGPLPYPDLVTFTIDSRKPRIYSTTPENGATIHGSIFTVRYTEENLESVTLNWRVVGDGQFTVVPLDVPQECHSGRFTQCQKELDLSEYNGKTIEYYFTVNDAINSVDSRHAFVHIDSTPPSLSVISPAQGGLYGSRRVPYDIESGRADLKYSVDSGGYRWLCRDCTLYSGSKSFRDGSHTVTIKAVDRAGNTETETRSFTVDSKPPRIHSTEPRQRFATGLFRVVYTESNLKQITLYINGIPVETKTDCPSGTREECTFIESLGDYDGTPITYRIVVEDTAGHATKSARRRLRVDLTPPSFAEIALPEDGGAYRRFVDFKIKMSERVKKLTYFDNFDYKERTLCTYCQYYTRRRWFRQGEHKIEIGAVDFAGLHSEVVERDFTVT